MSSGHNPGEWHERDGNLWHWTGLFEIRHRHGLWALFHKGILMDINNTLAAWPNRMDALDHADKLITAHRELARLRRERSGVR